MDAQKDVPDQDAHVLRRPRPERRPDPAGPVDRTRGGLRLRESTYGGRTHEPESESLGSAGQAINDTVAQNGVLLIPSFAIGRTQEVVWAMNSLLDAGRIPRIRLFLDSPMASKASTIYREHSDYYDAETLALLNKGEGPMDFPDAKETPLAAQSEAIERAQPAVRPGRVQRHAHRRPGPQPPPER